MNNEQKKNNINLSRVIELLEIYGWNDVDFRNRKFLVYSKYFDEHHKPYQVVIPSASDFVDFNDKARNALYIFSKLENQDYKMILQSVEEIKRDALKIRIISEATKDGNIPLYDASTIIENIKNLISLSIANENNPIPYIRRVPKEVKRLANSFQFGQTEVGSYVLSIEGKESNKACQLALIEDYEKPIWRKIFERIECGIELIESNIRSQELIEQSYIVGFNANMCDAFSNLMSVFSDTEIRLKFNWSSTLQKQNLIMDEHIVSSETVEKMKWLSEFYKSQENYQDVNFFAKVITLHATWKDSKEGQLLHHVATIKWFDNIAERYYSCKVQLNEEDYKIACDAHRDDETVSIAGTIDKSRKSWFMIEYNKFSIQV